MTTRHFLSLTDCTQEELLHIIGSAIAAKRLSSLEQVAAGKVLAMIFEKPSTRTRVSFEAGFIQLGGQALFLDSSNLQLGRGEPIADTARVISSMVDMVMIRTFAHTKIENFSNHSSVPVINGLTDSHHPCQLLADIMTYVELRGDIAGARVAFIGDCNNNMCNSYIEAARIFGFQLALACPEKYRPQVDASHVEIHTDPRDAAHNADMLVTDVWTSMGEEEQGQLRIVDFQGYQVSSSLLDLGRDTLFLHCLPAHRGEEVDHSILDDKRSGVWQASENRLHAQKALMKFLIDVNQL